MKKNIHIIGGGLAGCELAYQLSLNNIFSFLYEMRPNVKTNAHQTNRLSELVCSNSFRSDDSVYNAVGLLHQELRLSNSLIMEAADKNKVPAGSALAVDRDMFSEYVDRKIKSNKYIKVITKEIKQLKEEWMQEWLPKLPNNEAPINPYRVVAALNQLVDKEKVVITHDAGSPRDQITPFWESTAPLSYIGWGKTTQLGYGLGLAMGAKLAEPEKLCINVWGDAAIGFTGMDFETAVRENIPILSILFNNFSMAIELPIMPVSTEKYRSTDISGNYADMAKAFGGYGERVTDPNEIVAALERGIKATENGQAALLEFITDQEITISNE